MYIYIPVYVCFVFVPLLLNTVAMLLYSLYFVISTSVYIYIYYIYSILEKEKYIFIILINPNHVPIVFFLMTRLFQVRPLLRKAAADDADPRRLMADFYLPGAQHLADRFGINVGTVAPKMWSFP